MTQHQFLWIPLVTWTQQSAFITRSPDVCDHSKRRTEPAITIPHLVCSVYCVCCSWFCFFLLCSQIRNRSKTLTIYLTRIREVRTKPAKSYRPTICKRNGLAQQFINYWPMIKWKTHAQCSLLLLLLRMMMMMTMNDVHCVLRTTCGIRARIQIIHGV